MNFSEKKIYHQIHPLKLATDIFASVASLYLFWFHYFWTAIIIHILLPVLGSFFVIKYANLEKLKNSTLGKYVKKYMTVKIEVLRLIGDIFTIFGAWNRQWQIIILGIAIVIAAWINGKILKSN